MKSHVAWILILSGAVALVGCDEGSEPEASTSSKTNTAFAPQQPGDAARFTGTLSIEGTKVYLDSPEQGRRLLHLPSACTTEEQHVTCGDFQIATGEAVILGGGLDGSTPPTIHVASLEKG